MSRFSMFFFSFSLLYNLFHYLFWLYITESSAYGPSDPCPAIRASFPIFFLCFLNNGTQLWVSFDSLEQRQTSQCYCLFMRTAVYLK